MGWVATDIELPNPVTRPKIQNLACTTPPFPTENHRTATQQPIDTKS